MTNFRIATDTSSTPTGLKQLSRDPRALRILAKTIYRELRQGGLAEEDVMALAGELLSLVTCEVKDRRRAQAEIGEVPSTPSLSAAPRANASLPQLQR